MPTSAPRTAPLRSSVRSRPTPLAWLVGLAVLALPFQAPAGLRPTAGDGTARTGPDVPGGLARFARTGVAQVVDVRARGSYATVTAWERSGGVWTERYATDEGRVGANGVVPGPRRRQGTDTTPSGTYTLTRAFGVGRDPGTALPYHRVTVDDWWVEDPDSPYYNRMRTAAEGGFPLTESGDHGSEHLIDHPVQYDNAVVVDFNTDPVVRGRGAGIFLHDLGPAKGATAGCVAVPRPMLAAVMRWLDPARHPVIVIG